MENAYRVLIAPAPFASLPSESLEKDRWVVISDGIPWEPSAGLIELSPSNFEIDMWLMNGSPDERLISPAIRLGTRDFRFRFKERYLSNGTKAGDFRFGFMANSGKFKPSSSEELPNVIAVEGKGETTNYTVSIVAVDFAGTKTTSSLITLSLETNYYFELKRENTLLTLSIYSNEYGNQIVGSPITLDISGISIYDLNYLQLGCLNEGESSTGEIRVSNITVEPKEYLDVSHFDTGKIIDYNLQMDTNKAKGFDIGFDDSEDELSDLQNGDEIKVWFDNDARDVLISYDMESMKVSNFLNDFSGNGNHGYTPAPSFVEGVVERAFHFGGSTYINGSKYLGRLSAFSIVLHLKENNNTQPDPFSGAFIFGASPMIVLYHTNSPSLWHLKIRWDDSSTYDNIGTSIDLSDMEFHHLGFSYDGTNVEIYKDNIQIGTASIPNKTVTPNQVHYLGIGEGGGTFSNIDMDEFVFYGSSRTSSEMSLIYENLGMCPKLYFHGKIDSIQRKNENIEIRSTDMFRQLTDTQISDLIFEGHCLPTALGGTDDKLAYVYERNFEAHYEGSVSSIITQFEDFDGNIITGDNSGIIQQKIYMHKGGNPPNGSYIDADRYAIIQGPAGVTSRYFSFIAYGTRLKGIWLPIESTLLTRGGVRDFLLRVLDNRTDENGNDVPGGWNEFGPLMMKSFGDYVFLMNKNREWVYFDLESPNTYNRDMEVGKKYWIQTEWGDVAVGEYANICCGGADTSSNYNVILQGTYDGSKDYLIPSNIYKLGLSFILEWIDETEAYEEIDDSRYYIDYNNILGQYVNFSDVENPVFRLSSTGYPIQKQIKNSIKMSYIYTKGNLKIKHIIERLLRKTPDFSGIYSGRVTTTSLGMYAPQEKSLMECLDELTALSKSCIISRQSGLVSIEDLFRNSSLTNGSMETNGGWMFQTSVVGGLNGGYTTSSFHSGERSHMVILPSGNAVLNEKNIGIYQDITDWSGELNFWAMNDWAAGQFYVRVYREDYGGGNPVLIGSFNAGSHSVWSHYTVPYSSINTDRFRLYICIENTCGSTVIPWADFKFYVDDVTQGSTYYGVMEGFADESVTANEPSQYKFKNIINATVEDSTNEIVNEAIVFGTLGSKNVVSVARDEKLYDSFGPKIKVNKSSSFKKYEDVYTKAKSLIAGEREEQLTITLDGHNAFMFGKVIGILAPNSGFTEWTNRFISGMTISPETTTIKTTETKSLVSVLSNSKQDITEEGNAQQEILDGTFQYYIISDFQLTMDPTLGDIKECGIFDGAAYIYSKSGKSGYLNPDTGVHVFFFDKKRTANIIPDTYTRYLIVKDTDGNIVGDARLNYGDQFVKMGNVSLAVVLFSRRTLLGISEAAPGQQGGKKR